MLQYYNIKIILKGNCMSNIKQIVCKTCGNSDESLFDRQDSTLICKRCGTLCYDEIAESYYQSGREYYYGINEKDYKKAFEFFEKAALRGHAEAQLMLGSCYEQGFGTEIDYTKAVNWYTKASEQGLAKAKYKAAICYLHGYGVTKNKKKAQELFIEAAEQGDAEIQLQLGYSYISNDSFDFKKDSKKARFWLDKVIGQGTATEQFELAEKYCGRYENTYDTRIIKDFKEAAYWYTKAAENGSAEIKYKVAILYEKGDGVKKNIEQAIFWYTKAAENGSDTALYKLGKLYEKGEGVEKNIEQAIFWYTKAAENEYSLAQCKLGELYEKGEGVEKNIEQAIFWYTKAAENGSDTALYKLGKLYENGEGVEKNIEQATFWYTKAAENVYSRTQYELGELYKKGEDVEKDIEQAIFWYTKAAENRCFDARSDAQYELGRLYEKGEDVEKDIEQAVFWYTKAAENECFKAQYKLGKLYENGEGVEKDLQKAEAWYLKATENGNKEAIEALEQLDQPKMELKKQNFFKRNFFGRYTIAVLALLLLLFDGGKLGKAVYTLTPLGLGEATGIANFGFATTTFTVCTVIIYLIMTLIIKSKSFDKDGFCFAEHVLNTIVCLGIWYAGYGFSCLLVKITWGFRFFTVLAAIIITLIFIVLAFLVVGIYSGFKKYKKNNFQKCFDEISEILNVKFFVSLIMFHIGYAFTFHTAEDASYSFIPLLVLVSGAVFSVFYAIMRIAVFFGWEKNHVTNKMRNSRRKSEKFLLFVMIIMLVVLLKKHDISITGGENATLDMLLSPCFITLPFAIVSQFFAILSLKAKK